MTRPARDVPIRNAATVIAFRGGKRPEVLMGQRGAKAAFMPDKVVFPGGAVDAQDATIPLDGLPEVSCLSRLGADRAAPTPQALLAAAIREVWEETGLILGVPGCWPDPPSDWVGFAATGHRPDARGLRFIFRAVTPPGRPRRFDARFFLVSADRLRGEISGDGELANLHWIPLDAVRNYNLPFITQVVLAELPELIATDSPPKSVPFFHGDDEQILFDSLGGRAPLEMPQ